MQDKSEKTSFQEEEYNLKAPGFGVCSTTFDDVFILQRSQYSDNRGSFGKLYSEAIFKKLGISVDTFKETIYSISAKDVIRGMHYQGAPYGCSKLISVVKGAILDVIVNIKDCNDKEFGSTFSCILTSENNKSLFVPNGYAHGFKSLEEGTIVVYNQSENYSQEHDQGIAYNSFGFEWELKKPILSIKDRNLQPLKLKKSGK